MAFDIAAAIAAAKKILGDSDPETGPILRQEEARALLDTLGTPPVPELTLDPVITYFISRWQLETTSDTDRDRPLLHLTLVLVAIRLAQARELLAPGGSAADPVALGLLPDVRPSDLDGTTTLIFAFLKVNAIHEAILRVAAPAAAAAPTGGLVSAISPPRSEIERLLRGLHGACEGPLGGVWP